MRLLMQVERDVAVQPLLTLWLGGVRMISSVRVAVDVDPYSFM